MFERMQGFNASQPDCPECGGEVEQLISAPALQFKGSGWYVTDYARKPSATASEKKPAESKPESKPQSQPETGGKKKKD